MDAERSRPGLGAYVLPGPATDPKAVLDQARTAESFGLDVWIGERFDSKDLPALASAVGQVTRSARIGAALTVRSSGTRRSTSARKARVTTVGHWSRDQTGSHSFGTQRPEG